MRFADIKGNDTLKKKLAAMVDEGRMGHSMMLVEEGGWGALPLALATAQYMSCPNHSGGDSCGVCPECNKMQKLIHPDMHFAFPVNVTAKLSEGKKPVSDNFISIWRELVTTNPYFTEDVLSRELGIEDKVGTISVAEAKEILSKMNMRAYEGENKYMIIWLPERMTTEAANKLLKIVEEPFPKTYFFFISQSPEKVITTIRSRCLSINLLPLDSSLISGKPSPYFPLFSQILFDCISKDLTHLLLQNESFLSLGREKQKEFCRWSETFLRKILMVKKGLPALAAVSEEEKETVFSLSGKLPEPFFEKAFTHLENARSSIESNVNAKMVFCNLTNLLFVSI